MSSYLRASIGVAVLAVAVPALSLSLLGVLSPNPQVDLVLFLSTLAVAYRVGVNLERARRG